VRAGIQSAVYAPVTIQNICMGLKILEVMRSERNGIVVESWRSSRRSLNWNTQVTVT
jgi:hypothetical protein